MWHYGSFGQEFSLLDPATYPTLQRGSKGSDVRTMQEKLMALGYPFPNYGADGDFGNEAEFAVIQFQKINGLSSNGIFGKSEWTLLLTGSPKRFTGGQVVSTVNQTSAVKVGGSPLLAQYFANQTWLAKLKANKNVVIIGASAIIIFAAWFALRKISENGLSKAIKQNPSKKKDKKMYVIDDKTKKVLFEGSKENCEHKLNYFLNHGHDAYLTDDKEGYEEDHFTVKNPCGKKMKKNPRLNKEGFSKDEAKLRKIFMKLWDLGYDFSMGLGGVRGYTLVSPIDQSYRNKKLEKEFHDLADDMSVESIRVAIMTE